MSHFETKSSLVRILNRYSLFFLMGLMGLSTHLRAEDGVTLGVDFSVGSDSNIYEDDPAESDSFYELKPNFAYSNTGFTGSAYASMKNFSKEENSNQAKTSGVGTGLAYNTELGMFKSATNANFDYTYKRKARSGSTEGIGTNVMDFKLGQGLGWNMGQMNMGVKADLEREDADAINTVSDTPDIFEEFEYLEGYTILKLAFNVDIVFNEMVTFKVEPAVKQKTWDEYPARQTDGNGGLVSDVTREHLDNTLKASLPMTFGNFSVSPSFTFGMRNDRGFGGEDNTNNTVGLDASFTVPQAYNLKLSFGYSLTSTTFDNWTYQVTSGKREDDETNISLGAAMDFNKNFSFGLNYAGYEIDSTRNNTAVNYKRDITTGTLSMKF